MLALSNRNRRLVVPWRAQSDGGHTADACAEAVRFAAHLIPIARFRLTVEFSCDFTFPTAIRHTAHNRPTKAPYPQ